MKIGFIQFHPEFGEVEKNIRRATEYIQKTDADLLVLPELFNAGYTFVSKEEARSFSEEIPNGNTTQAMITVAKETNTAVAFGLAEKDGDRLYNSSVLVSPEGFVGNYRKVHLYYKEKLWFEKGDLGFPVWEVNGAKIGMLICFDWIYPETMRVLALKGAQIICHCANLVLPYCQKAMRTRSLENHVFIISCNRIGEEKRGDDDFSFTGYSVMLSPTGEYLANGPRTKEFVAFMDVDPTDADDKHINEFNDLFEDRGTEFFGNLV